MIRPKALDSAFAGSISGRSTLCNNFGKVVYTHHQVVYFCTRQEEVMVYGWGGNRRSGVAMAMRHKLPVVCPPAGSRLKEER